MLLLQVHQETFGKSGCRRIVPGQYLAIDPKGRAIMIGELRIIKSSNCYFCIKARSSLFFVFNKYFVHEHYIVLYFRLFGCL